MSFKHRGARLCVNGRLTKPISYGTLPHLARKVRAFYWRECVSVGNRTIRAGSALRPAAVHGGNQLQGETCAGARVLRYAALGMFGAPSKAHTRLNCFYCLETRAQRAGYPLCMAVPLKVLPCIGITEPIRTPPHMGQPQFGTQHSCLQKIHI